MTNHRELATAALLGVVGAGLAAGSAGRTWATVVERGGADLMPSLQPITGRSLGGVVGALGWVGLAGIAAMVATRGWARTVVGVLLTVFGAVIAVASPTAVRRAHVVAVAADTGNLTRLAGRLSVQVGGWWIAALAGGVLLAAAGLLTVVRGRRWPGMSARYDRPGAAPPPGDDPTSLWRSLDRGADPTADPVVGASSTGEPADGGRTADDRAAGDRGGGGPAGTDAAGEDVLGDRPRAADDAPGDAGPARGGPAGHGPAADPARRERGKG